MQTARGVEYRLTKTPTEHAETLGPITLSVDIYASGNPFRMQDYLTTDEALRLAGDLMAHARQVEGDLADLPF